MLKIICMVYPTPIVRIKETTKVLGEKGSNLLAGTLLPGKAVRLRLR